MKAGVVEPEHHRGLGQERGLCFEKAGDFFAGISELAEGSVHLVHHDHGEGSVAPVLAPVMVDGGGEGQLAIRRGRLEMGDVLKHPVFVHLEVGRGAVGNYIAMPVGDDEIEHNHLASDVQSLCRWLRRLSGENGRQKKNKESQSARVSHKGPTMMTPLHRESCGESSRKIIRILRVWPWASLDVWRAER